MSLKAINKVYAIISLEDLSKVDFSQVGESSADTVRKNLLNPPTQFLLKWDTEPEFIADGTIIPDGIYTHEEVLELLRTEDWMSPDPGPED